MKNILQHIVRHKQVEVERRKAEVPIETLAASCCGLPPARSLEKVLERPGPAGVNIIAEIKRASPSRGAICPGADAGQVARKYQAGGAAAISVLTDGKFFNGSLEDLVRVRAVTDLPVLCKDFILSSYQVTEARASGADAVLLIVRILDPDRLDKLLDQARGLGMEALVEVYDQEELETATAVGATVIAVNNRDLKTFTSDLRRAVDIAAGMKSWQVAVAASAITGPLDIRRNLDCGIFNFLVGESLMRSADSGEKLRELLHGWRQIGWYTPR